MKVKKKKKEQKNEEPRYLQPFYGERPFLSLREAMNRLFDESFWDPFEPFSSSVLAPLRQRGFPKVDISEDEEEITVTANVPGIKADDIELEVAPDNITLSGKTEKETEEKKKKFYRYEREYGSFSRTLPLPAEIDPDKVSAKVKDGVLTVTLPKVKSGRKKKVKVEKE